MCTYVDCSTGRSESWLTKSPGPAMPTRMLRWAVVPYLLVLSPFSGARADTAPPSAEPAHRGIRDDGIVDSLLRCDAATVREYLAHGGDPNALADRATDPTRPTTLLVLASNNGCLDLMRILIARGADPNLADPTGETPLLRAAGHLYRTGVGSMRLLLDAGADVNGSFPRGTTPLMLVVCPAGLRYRHLYRQAVELLLARKADVARRFEDGTTALSQARHCGSDEIVPLLIRARTK